MLVFTSLLAGLVFGLGLIVSGMANPAKVLGLAAMLAGMGLFELLESRNAAALRPGT